jgi:hypothetical protein
MQVRVRTEKLVQKPIQGFTQHAKGFRKRKEEPRARNRKLQEHFSAALQMSFSVPSISKQHVSWVYPATSSEVGTFR